MSARRRHVSEGASPLESRHVLYGRVSSAQQRDGGTIEAQLAAGRARYAAEGVTDYEVITDDGVSGALPLRERPGGQRLLQLAATSPRLRIRVWKLDRFGRDAGDTVVTCNELARLGHQLESLTEAFESGTPSGDFMLGIYAHVAQLERDKLGERFASGRERVTRQGRWSGGRAPYGYRIADKRLEVFEPEAEWVRWMAGRYLDGAGFRQVAVELNAMGVPARKTVWRKSTVAMILTKPTYRGTRKLGWSRGHGRVVTAEGPCPAILDEATANAIDALERRGGHQRQREYPLTGLLRCGTCGRSLCGEASKGTAYYRCRSHGEVDGGSCGQRMVRADVAEGLAWESLSAFLRDPARLERWADGLLSPPPEAPKIDVPARRRELEAERARLRWEVRRGDITDEEYARDMDGVKAGLDALDRLERQADDRPDLKLVRRAVDRATVLAAGLDDVPADERPQLVAAFLERATVAPHRSRSSAWGYRGAIALESEFVWTLESLLAE